MLDGTSSQGLLRRPGSPTRSFAASSISPRQRTPAARHGRSRRASHSDVIGGGRGHQRSAFPSTITITIGTAMSFGAAIPFEDSPLGADATGLFPPFTFVSCPSDDSRVRLCVLVCSV